MLPSKLKAGILPSAQSPPKFLFFLGLIAAKISGDFL